MKGGLGEVKVGNDVRAVWGRVLERDGGWGECFGDCEEDWRFGYGD